MSQIKKHHLFTCTDSITVNLGIAISDGPSQITLEWDNVKCADEYRVEYSQINKDDCQPIDSSSASVNTHCSCSSMSTAIPGLDSYSLYLVRVRARLFGYYAPAAERELMTGTSGKFCSSSPYGDFIVKS